MSDICLNNATIAVVGLGYVGLPLAVEFGKYRDVIGYDQNKKRIAELKENIDSTFEVDTVELKKAKHLVFSGTKTDLKRARIYIICVPTPINKNKKPDLASLKKASNVVGKLLAEGDFVIYESTVYPGATEEICLPILERHSGLKCIYDKNNGHEKGFYLGYSPERINPGDKNRRLKDIVKVVSGSSISATEAINELYSAIIPAGTFVANSICVAEAAKIIENTQRDVNIALINELAIIFNKMGIDTSEVLEAASTKWNFLPFQPGLVGGHCIGVDPYYLTFKAKSIGYKPEIILSGRKLNDQMGTYVALKLLKEMEFRNFKISGAKILIMGYTFKENCPDTRNTKVIDVISELKKHDCNVFVHDPWLKDFNNLHTSNINFVKKPQKAFFDAIIIAVAHKEFKSLSSKIIHGFGKTKHIVYDLKNMLDKETSDLRL